MVDNTIISAVVEGQIRKIIALCDAKIARGDRVKNMQRIKESAQQVVDSGNDDLMVAWCQKMGVKL
jgi:hypothetical protein